MYIVILDETKWSLKMPLNSDLIFDCWRTIVKIIKELTASINPYSRRVMTIKLNKREIVISLITVYCWNKTAHCPCSYIHLFGTPWTFLLPFFSIVISSNRSPPPPLRKFDPAVMLSLIRPSLSYLTSSFSFVEFAWADAATAVKYEHKIQVTRSRHLGFYGVTAICRVPCERSTVCRLHESVQFVRYAVTCGDLF